MIDFSSVVATLDESARRFRFVILDGGKQKPGTARMTLYRDDYNWALVMEEVAFFSPSPGHSGIVDMVTKIGNCIGTRSVLSPNDDVKVTSDAPGMPTFLPPYQIGLDPSITAITVRGKLTPVDLNPDSLKKRGIPLRADGSIQGEQLLWSLLPECREELLATDAERRTRLPTGIPKLLQLDKWHHPLFMTRRLKPSQTQVFQMLAEVIATGDVSRYRPTEEPNTDWRNWLNSERI
jgi:hypothetical protein